MNKEGLSTNRPCHPFAPCLATEGKTFVIRYYSRTTSDPQKRITPAEANAMAQSGLDIVTVYQDRATALTDFGQARGKLDGQSAHDYATRLRQPPGSAIYFAVDMDVNPEQINDEILPYFEGVKEGMDQEAGGLSPFVIGVYGSGLTCQLVRENHALAQYAWLAGATAWTGSGNYDTWNIRQHANHNHQQLCGLQHHWERCEAHGNFGQFRPVP